jgi:hypothetical protein
MHAYIHTYTLESCSLPARDSSCLVTARSLGESVGAPDEYKDMETSAGEAS